MLIMLAPDTKDLLSYAVVVILGYLVELIGVHTELFFGRYAYGLGLGYKLAEVPLLIGANWLLVVLGASAILAVVKPVWIRMLTGAILIVGYDVLLEPFAISVGLWSWPESGRVPTQNYLDWALFGVLFMLLLYLLAPIRRLHKGVATIFLVQWLFFYVISRVLKLV